MMLLSLLLISVRAAYRVVGLPLPVDPVADAAVRLLRLDVDVGGPVADALRDDEIHDLNDRCVGGTVRRLHGPRRDGFGGQEGVDVASDAGEGSVRLVDRAPD